MNPSTYVKGEPEKDHFTAVIKISQTINRGTMGARETAEVSSIVVRADSIEKLRTKAIAHLQLLEED